MTAPNQTASQAYGTSTDLAKLVGLGAFEVGNASENYGQDVTEDFVRTITVGPASFVTEAFTDIGGFISGLGNFLRALPLEALQMFRQFIPGALYETFLTIEGAVAAIMDFFSNLGGALHLDSFMNWLSSVFGLLASEVGQVFEIVAGGVVTAVSAAVQGFKDAWAAITGGVSAVTSGLGDLANDLLHNAQAVIGNISGVIADAGHTLQDIWNAIGAGLGGALSGHNAATLNAQAVQLALTAQDAEAAAYAAQWTLQQMTGQGNSGGGGVTFDMDIVGADGDALSATDWASTSNMVVRVTGSVAAMGITAGTTVGAISYANCAHQYLSDSQSIAAVLGPKGDSTSATILHFHCNSTYTRGMYLSILTTGVTLGYFTGALGSRTYTPLTGGTLTKAMTSGTRVEARDAGTNTYAILVNGIPSLTVNDPGAHAVAGDFYAQVTETSRTVIYNAGLPWQTTGTNYSFQLASILLSDYIVPTYVGSTASMYRTSTGTVSLNASPNAILGSSFFNVVERVTPDITADLVNSKFTVSKAGTYLVGLRASIDTGTNTTNTQQVTPLLYVNGSVYRWGDPTVATYVVGNNGSLWRIKPDAMESTFRVYLQAGDYVQPGWNNQHIASGTVTGEATGTQTFFDITRIGD